MSICEIVNILNVNIFPEIFFNVLDYFEAQKIVGPLKFIQGNVVYKTQKLFDV